MDAVAIRGVTALVTGANRGIGKAIVEQLLAGGAAKVYAAARDVSSLPEFAGADGRVVPLPLDVTQPDQIKAAAAAALDVGLLVNNAGVVAGPGIAQADGLDNARLEMEVNYFAPMAMSQAFAAILARQGGGGLVNVLSVAGLVSFPFAATYSASKAAGHSLTQGLRAELAGQGTAVYGVYPGPVDTDMAAGIDMPKATPTEVAGHILRAVERGDEDIFPDPYALQLHQDIVKDPKGVERMASRALD